MSMTQPREQFSSRLGFILAAAGSAVGIGNLVGFPVNAANYLSSTKDFDHRKLAWEILQT